MKRLKRSTLPHIFFVKHLSRKSFPNSLHSLTYFLSTNPNHKNGQVTKEHFKKIIADANDLVPHVFFADVSMNDNDGGLGLKDTIQPGFADGIFQLFDTDHDGRIAFDELLQVQTNP